MKPSPSLVRPDVLLRPLRQAPTLRPSHRLPRSVSGASQCRTFIRRERAPSSRAFENLNVDRMRHDSYDYHVRRRNFLAAGAAAGAIAFVYTAYLLKQELAKPKKLDSGVPANIDPFTTEAGSKRKTVVHDEQGREMVPTGNTTVKLLPRTLEFDVGANSNAEYTLVGCGTRTVTFVGFEVYVVGYYIATQDIAAIQKKLVKEINPIATTLVPSEREELQRRLLDPAESERLWLEILHEVKPRSAFQLTPVRNTDFPHLRDGLVRAITARTQGRKQEYSDDAFGEAMKDFRALFNRGKCAAKTALTFVRDQSGRLTMIYDDGKKKSKEDLIVGHVLDERVSRALWENYLAGKNVASEPARQSIVTGIMEFVERPVGTVAAQVI